MGNGWRAHVHGVSSVILKLTLEKTVLLKHVQQTRILLVLFFCRDVYKVFFESNKCVVLRHGTFVGKGYDCGGLFRLSLMDVCNNAVTFVSVCDETDLWHSRLCHVNFGCLTQSANMSLIPKFNNVKGSK
jgi:hypothetical protein